MDSFQKSDFIGLIQQHQRLINSVCAAWYRNEEDLKDLRQDIILQLWKSFPSFRGDSTPATWIYKVSLHTVLRKRRQENRRISGEPLGWENALGIAAPAFDDDVQHLRYLISRLEDVDRATILLYLEGYSQKEIAGMLDMSSTNVSTRINRIKSRLKRLHKDHQYESR